MKTLSISLAALSLSACSLNASVGAAPTVSLPVAPPVVRGGTLAVREDGGEVIVVDRDRGLVHALAIVSGDVGSRSSWDLSPARADRAVYAGARRLALRDDGELLSLEQDGQVHELAATCPEARGLAFDADRERAWVSCASGALLGISLASPEDVVRFFVAPDLGDVVVRGDALWVVQVRRANVFVVSALDGTMRTRVSMPYAIDARQDEPAAALRLIDAGDGVLVLHERMSNVAPRSGYYEPAGPDHGGACGTPSAHVTVTRVHDDGSVEAGPVVAMLAYASDAALDPMTGAVALVSPSRLHPDSSLPNAVSVPMDAGQCATARARTAPGQATAVAYLPSGALLVQTREPASIVIDGLVHALPGDSVRDTGHDIFHSDETAEGLPCVACHVDGGSDGHVWNLGAGERVTPSVRGGLTSTAPFHWKGDVPDLPSLFALHFQPISPRASGTTLQDDQIDAFARWVDALPASPRTSSDPSLASVGRDRFFALGCAGCHGPEGLSPTPDNVELGDGLWQVPALVDLGDGTPLGHDGCAQTVDALLQGACGWSNHHVDSADDRAALAAFLGAPSAS